MPEAERTSRDRLFLGSGGSFESLTPCGNLTHPIVFGRPNASFILTASLPCLRQTTHPSPEELSAFSLGQLPPDEAAVVESHISECQPCCETMLGLSSDDTFVALLQEAKQLPTDQTLDQDGFDG